MGRDEPPWDAPLNVPARARASLTQSIREVQIGDGGGPASLIAFNAETFRGGGDDVRKLVDLWFDEEKEHSRLQGRWSGDWRPRRSPAIGASCFSASSGASLVLPSNCRSSP